MAWRPCKVSRFLMFFPSFLSFRYVPCDQYRFSGICAILNCVIYLVAMNELFGREYLSNCSISIWSVAFDYVNTSRNIKYIARLRSYSLSSRYQLTLLCLNISLVKKKLSLQNHAVLGLCDLKIKFSILFFNPVDCSLPHSRDPV